MNLRIIHKDVAYNVCTVNIINVNDSIFHLHPRNKTSSRITFFFCRTLNSLKISIIHKFYEGCSSEMM